jgi:hypothetical protein
MIARSLSVLHSKPLFAFAFALAPLTAACSSLDRFDTEGKAAFCGDLVSAPRFQGGLLPAGVPPALSLRVELQPDRLTARGVSPAAASEQLPEPYVVVGDVTSDDAMRGLCRDMERPLFNEAALRTIPELDHDLLRLLEFGEGRDYNFMAWVDSTCQGTMLAVISLMRNDTVEIRLLKPAALAPPDAEPARRPGFGLFYLHREDEGCDF